MMKKIFLTMMVAVAMVNAANAATTWQFSGVANPDYGYAYVFGAGEEEHIAQCFEEYIDTGNKSDYEEAMKTIKNGTRESVSFSDGSGSGDYAFFEGDIVGIVFLDNSASPTRYMIADHIEYGDECLNFDMSGTDWTALPVPEPTSGMLLLIGMAGIALRRRRTKRCDVNVRR